MSDSAAARAAAGKGSSGGGGGSGGVAAAGGGDGTSLRVAVVGAARSGKTAMLVRLLYDEFEAGYAATVENEYRATFVVGYRELQVDFLDTGGADEVSTAEACDRWFTWANAVLFVYSVRDEETFLGVKRFRDQLQAAKAARGISFASLPTVLVGMSADCTSDARAVSIESGRRMADALGCPYRESSAADNGVQTALLRTSAEAENATAAAEASKHIVPITALLELLVAERERRSAAAEAAELTLPSDTEGSGSRGNVSAAAAAAAASRSSSSSSSHSVSSHRSPPSRSSGSHHRGSGSGSSSSTTSSSSSSRRVRSSQGSGSGERRAKGSSSSRTAGSAASGSSGDRNTATPRRSGTRRSISSSGGKDKPAELPARAAANSAAAAAAEVTTTLSQAEQAERANAAAAAFSGTRRGSNIARTDVSGAEGASADRAREEERMVPLFVELRQKWGKPLSQLPVYIDFPRLASKIVVQTGDAKLDPSARRKHLAAQLAAASPEALAMASAGKSRLLAGGASRGSSDFMSSSAPAGTTASSSGSAVAAEPPSRADKYTPVGTAALKSREAKKRRKARRDDTDELSVGARVRIHDADDLGKGTVRFIGSVKFSRSTMVGIELDKHLGDCDGSIGDAKYFACAPSKGCFVETTDVELLFHKTAPDTFTGGQMKQVVSFAQQSSGVKGEVWTFDATTGNVTSNVEHEGKPLRYNWDGEYFKPEDGCASLGAGQWNGEHIIWYDKDWMIFRTSKRDVSIKLAFNQSQQKYFAADLLQGLHSVLMALLPWKWTSPTTFACDPIAEWTVDEVGTKLPPELPVFVQILYYRRFGAVEGGDAAAAAAAATATAAAAGAGSALSTEGGSGAGAAAASGSGGSSSGSTAAAAAKSAELVAAAKAAAEEATRAAVAAAEKEAEAKRLRAERALLGGGTDSESATDGGGGGGGGSDSASSQTGAARADSVAALRYLQLEELPAGEEIRVTVQLNSWRFRVPIPAPATIAHVKHEVAKRVARRLAMLAERLEDEKAVLFARLAELIKAVQSTTAGRATEAAATMKEVVRILHERVEDIEGLAVSQLPTDQARLWAQCERIDELAKRMVRATITALKTSTSDAYVGLSMIIGEAHALADVVVVSHFSVEALTIIAEGDDPAGAAAAGGEMRSKAEAPAPGSVRGALDDDMTMAALLQQQHAGSGGGSSDGPALLEVVAHVRPKDSAEIADEELVRQQVARLREERAEAEQQAKWSSLFSSMQADKDKAAKAAAAAEAAAKMSSNNGAGAAASSSSSSSRKQKKSSSGSASSRRAAKAAEADAASAKAAAAAAAAEAEAAAKAAADAVASEKQQQQQQRQLKQTNGGGPADADLHPMQRVLLELGAALGEDAAWLAGVRSEWSNFVKETGDAARQLSAFLAHMLTEDSRTCRVLKAINQSIIASPFVRLKFAFPAEMGFEDTSGTWKIIVQVTPGEEVAVLHQKESASRQDMAGGFEFKWELLMRFNWELTAMDEGTLYFTDLMVKPGTDADLARQVRRTLKDFHV